MKPTATVRCAHMGCTEPVPVGQIVCLGHLPRPAPLTVRESIAKGPRFEPSAPDADGARCVCGDGVSVRDKATGLCAPCWRAWRWSSIREWGRP